MSLWMKICVTLALGIAAGLSAWHFTDPRVNAASSGTAGLLTIQGSGAGASFGDYVSDAGALNTSYHYFIEVPPNLARLKVDIFDADIGMGGTAEAAAGRDRDRSGFNSSVSYTLFNPSGQQRTTQFTTGDATGPAGSDNAWLTFFDSTGDAVRDDFSSVSYGNNDGLINWTGNWIETNDDNNPGTGLIKITGGELRIQDNGDANPSMIEREANLSAAGFSTATLSFDFRTSNVQPGDKTGVQISNNGGVSWTTLETFNGSFAPSSRTYNITSSIATNTRVRFITSGIGFSGANAFFVDNVQIKDSSIAAGHWEVRVNMSSSVTAGDDINAFGIRANDGDATAGGTELNIYADSFYALGVNPPAAGTTSRSYTMYPYISSGCSCSKNDFDFDSNNGDVGSLSLNSRTGVFTQDYASAALSANDTWRRDSFSGWTSDSVSDEYGIWTADATIKSYLVFGTPNGNLANLYFGNFQAVANPPTANPAANAFRIYLPNDAGTAPSKPYVDQRVIGPATTIKVGNTADVVIWLQVINPTSQTISFSSSDFVTANIPGGGAVYAGHAAVAQGTIVSQPAVNGTGNITWNPGTIAANSRAVLMYYVNVTPTAAGQRIPVTGTPASGNGTRAKFVDETGNTTQARATYQFGPLCELAVTENGLLPIAYPPGRCGMSSLANGVKGQFYDHTVGPLTPVVVAGSLPPGLAIMGSHVTGTPTTPGTFNFSLMNGSPGFLCAASQSYTMSINTPTATNGTISGSMANENGAPIEGAVVRLNGTQSRKTITDANGNYHFDNVETEGFYTITPSRANYTFNPFNRSFSLVGNKTEALFTGTSTGDNANPLDTPEFFVRQQYLDILGREPDETGFNYWSDQINQCLSEPPAGRGPQPGSPYGVEDAGGPTSVDCLRLQRINVAAAFFIAEEFQASGSYLYDIYVAALDRRPMFGEFSIDLQQLVGGAMLDAAKSVFAQRFVQRTEFMTRYQGNTTAESFVDALIQNVHSATVDLSGQRNSLIVTYNSYSSMDASRAAVVRAIADSAAFKQSQYNQGFVLTEYFAYLRRDAEGYGYNFWVNVLNNSRGSDPGAYRGMVCSFVTAAEYQRRFSSIVSHSNGECE